MDLFGTVLQLQSQVGDAVPELEKRPLTFEALVDIRDKVRLAPPIAERVVAAIVGVPPDEEG